MKHKRTLGDYVFDFIIYLVMLVVFVVSLYPFWYVVMYSFSTSGSVGSSLLLYPKGFNVDSYRLLMTVDKIPHALMISVARSVIGPVLSILVTAMAAYALMNRDLVGRSFFVKLLMITMYFSSGMIPSYLLMSEIGLTGTFWVYIIPGLFGVYNMVLIKTYMESLPDGLAESAMIDGANDFVIFFRIVFPLSKPVLAAVLLFLCIGQWNSYSDTMIYNSSQTELHTLSYVLMNFIQTSSSSVEEARKNAQMNNINSTSLKMAMTVITTVPIMLVYPMLQKNFAKGILIGSIKG